MRPRGSRGCAAWVMFPVARVTARATTCESQRPHAPAAAGEARAVALSAACSAAATPDLAPDTAACLFAPCVTLTFVPD
jgi:hypothetical protein